MAIGNELKNHQMVRRIANKFGDAEYEHMIEFLNKPEMKKTLEESGDMDFIGPLVKAAIKNPYLMMQSMKLAGKGLFF